MWVIYLLGLWGLGTLMYVVTDIGEFKKMHKQWRVEERRCASSDH